MKNVLTDQLQTEVDTSYLYGILSSHAEKKELSSVYRQMSEIEHGHAEKILRCSGSQER